MYIHTKLMRHVQHICFLIKIIKIIIQYKAKQFQSPFNFMLHCLQRNILTKWLTLVCSHIWNKWHNLKMCINKYEEIRVQNISSESPSTDYTMISSGAEIATKSGQQPRNIFCLNDQGNIACLRGVYYIQTSNFSIFCILYTESN